MAEAANPEQNGAPQETAFFERKTVEKKLPFLKDKVAKKEVMEQLDDLGEAPYKPRVRKYPGYTWIEAYWHVDWTKDGKRIEHRGTEMMKRSFHLGAYQGQQLGYWLMKRRKKVIEKDMQLKGRFDRVLANAKEAPEGQDDKNSKGPNSNLPRVVRRREDDVHISLNPAPHENIIGHEKPVLLRGPNRPGPVVPAPRLLTGPRGPGPVVPAPRLLTGASKAIGEKQGAARAGADRERRRIGVDRPAGLLPAPRPVKRREPEAEEKQSFKREQLRSKGRAAALRAAQEKAKEAQTRMKQSSRKDDQR